VTCYVFILIRKSNMTTSCINCGKVIELVDIEHIAEYHCYRCSLPLCAECEKSLPRVNSDIEEEADVLVCAPCNKAIKAGGSLVTW